MNCKENICKRTPFAPLQTGATLLKKAYHLSPLEHQRAKDSFLHNQSFPGPKHVNSSINQGSMHTCSAHKFRGDELNAIRFTPLRTSPPEKDLNPLDRSWMLYSYIESNMGSQTLHSYVHNPKKAFLTINARTTQILTGNKIAFNLLGITDREQHLKLKDFILSPIEPHTFLEDDLALNGEVILFSGKVVDLVTKKGKTIPVSMWARQLSADTDKRCLVIMEPVQRMRGKVGWDTRGEIIACDQSFAEMFGYEVTAEIDMIRNIRDFIPTLELDMENYKEGEIAHIKLCATGKRKDNFYFPLNLNIQTLTLPNVKSKRFVPPIFDATVLVYSNISGLISFLPDGSIHSCNTNLTMMLFGYSQEELLGRDISQLIPSFYDDLDLDTNSIALPPFDEDEDAHGGNSDDPTESLSGDLPRPSNPLTKPVNKLGFALCGEEDDLARQSLSAGESVSPEGDLELIEHSSPDTHSNRISCDSVTDCNANPLLTPNASADDCCVLRSSAEESGEEEEDYESDSESDLSESGEETFDSEEDSACSEDEFTEGVSEGERQVCSPSFFESKHSLFDCTHFAVKVSTPKQNASKSSRDYSYLNIPEGNYAGIGRHKDGTDLAIEYHMRKVLLDNGNCLYCLWVFRDPEEIKESLQSESSRNSQSYEEDESYSSISTSSSNSELDDEEYVEGTFSQHYKVVQHLTKGAFGCIKKAYRRTDRLIVITKFIQKSEVYKDSWVFDETLKKDVPLEVSLLTVIQHPNIVKVLDVFENAKCFQLVMEKHGSGMDLFEFIERAPALDEPLSSYIFRQMVSAISFLHNLQIVHRDIKDENVIIDEKFHIKLIDFGSATFMGGEEEEFTTFCGTTEYCSPEVLRGHKYRGPELEMFALGVTLFTLVLGQNPFGNADEILQGKYTINKDISQSLIHLIDHLLEPIPEDRYTLAEVEGHDWVKQPVTIENYAFSEVLSASEEELHPIKYYSFTEEELAQRVEEIDLNHSALS